MRSIEFFDVGHDMGPERACIVDGDVSYTFAEVKAKTERVARALYSNGFLNQQQIALYGPNSGDILIVLLSIWRANGSWVPVNTRNAVDANIQFLNYVGTQWLFYHSSMADDVDMLRANCPALKNFVCIDMARKGDPSLDQFVAEYEDGPFEPVDVDEFGNLEDVVGIFPTGGTTGPSKGVVVNNLGWSTMLQTVAAALDRRTEDPKTLVTAPVTHAAGPVSLATLSIGATQVIMSGFEPTEVLANIEKHQISHMYLPPTAMYMLLDHPDCLNTDTSSLKAFVLVGSPVSPKRFGQAVSVFGECMCQAYGQVESPMIMTWLAPEAVAQAVQDSNFVHRLASCGRATHGARIAVMDDSGNILPDGETGEIVSRGPLVSQEYFGKPDATAEVREFGWHHTGDVGFRDRDGYYYIVDRKKDMVITGGFNVFTAEVEAAITELPEVKGCAVFGLPHDKWGEQVYACVVADDISEAKIISYAKEKLGGVKAPKQIEFVSEIPITANGKMDKKSLRAARWNSARNVN